MPDNAFDQLKAELAIDPLDLDNELIQLPQLVMEIGENLAEAIAAYDRAKENLDRARGEAGRRLRNGPARKPQVEGERPQIIKEWKQPSEAQIATEIPLIDIVVEAQDRVGELQLIVSKWKELHWAMRQKSSSIEQYVKLMAAGYMTPNSVHQQRRQEIADTGTARYADDRR